VARLRAAPLIFLFLFFSIHFAASCPTADKKIYLAAVTGENSGGIFQLEVQTRPGNGTVYTGVSPRTGFATQDSEEAAVDYAFASSGIPRSACDVLFRINGNFETSSIDGPSAGGAMAVATRAALLGKNIRQDMVMTGTVSPDGKVGAVGGVIEKSLAAADSGAAYILVPSLQLQDAILISSATSSSGFQAIEVQNVSGAERMLFSNYSQKFSSEYRPESKPIPAGLPPIAADAEIGRFTLVAKKVVDELDMKVRQVFARAPKNNETESLRSYFNQEISNYYSLLPLGYPFTSANAAFLLSIDAEYVRIGDSKIDLDGSTEDVSTCIAGLKKPQKTRENFQWAVGADLRRLWASQKLNQTEENRASQDGYTSLRDLLFSYSWCQISSQLSVQADDVGGGAVDESLLSSLAADKISEAEETLSSSVQPDYDAAWHLQNAYVANESGDYGAAIYEATYASVMQKIASEPVENITNATEKLAEAERTSLWGKIYYGQGMYLYAQAKEGKFAPTDAYRILKYSSELDKMSAEIDRELLKKKGESVQRVAGQAAPKSKAPTEQDAILAVVLLFCVALFGLTVVWRLARERKVNPIG
jgi:hypothetical protein